MGLIPNCGHFGVVGVSLNKKFTQIAPVHPAVQMGTCCQLRKHPTYNINRYLVITGEANVKLLSIHLGVIDHKLV